MKKRTKIYLKKTLNEGLGYHANIGNMHITMRFAGKPAFILEAYQDKYGSKEGAYKYREYLNILNDISNRGVSPFVIYSNNIIKKSTTK